MLFFPSKITIRFRPKKFHLKPKLALQVNFFHKENFRSHYNNIIRLLHIPSQRKTTSAFSYHLQFNWQFSTNQNRKKIKTKYKQCGNPITIQIEWISASDERRGKVCETSQTIFIGSDNYSVSANQSCVWATNTPKAKNMIGWKRNIAVDILQTENGEFDDNASIQ